MPKSLVGAVVALCGAVLVQAEPAMKQDVHFKYGSVVRGMILQQIPDGELKIKVGDGRVMVYNMHQVAKISAAPEMGGGAKPNSALRSPGTALALSLVLPGLGQYYNKEYAKGVIQQAIFIGGVAAALSWGVYDGRETYWDTWEGEYASRGEVESTSWLYIGFGMAAGAAV